MPHAALSRDRPRIVIIGAGPGGLCMGIRLLAAGFENFVILEQAAGVGGTWWHNRYPGAACDVPSHLYSFSFELKRDWSSPYAAAPEILAYLLHCAEKYALLPHLRFNTTVAAARWLLVGARSPVVPIAPVCSARPSPEARVRVAPRGPRSPSLHTR